MLIESVQNTKIKNLARLKNKKDREEAKLFLAEGEHLLEEARNAGILKIVYQLQTLPQFDETIETVFCTQPVLNKLSAQKSDACYIGVCAFPEETELAGSRFLLLDGLQDPGNVGTLIRSAYAFGIDRVFLSPNCADLYSSKVIQSSQGAVFHIPCTRGPLLEQINGLKQNGTIIYGTALHQNSIELSQVKPEKQFAIVVGSEGAGISREIMQSCDVLVHIEMQQFESLNAAIAGSIVLYDFQMKN